MIYNDFVALDKHIHTIENCRQEMIKAHKRMEKRIYELNANGFQDGNFERLYYVFTNNLENIKKIESKILEAEQYCQKISQIIKQYYNIEI